MCDWGHSLFMHFTYTFEWSYMLKIFSAICRLSLNFLCSVAFLPFAFCWSFKCLYCHHCLYRIVRCIFYIFCPFIVVYKIYLISPPILKKCFYLFVCYLYGFILCISLIHLDIAFLCSVSWEVRQLYSWFFNNVGIKGTIPLSTVIFKYSFWLSSNLTSNSLLLTRNLTNSQWTHIWYVIFIIYHFLIIK